MAQLGQNFPMTREARREKLNEIKKNDNYISTVKVPGHGIKKVYRIPLEYVSYNPYNTRFLAQAKTLETRLGRKLSDERVEDIKEIEKFIWNHKTKSNINTIDSLIKDGQLLPGVVTPTGVVLSGNRRFRLLNEISRYYAKYSKKGNLEGLQFFEAAILDEELDEKEIRKYESFYQYGREGEVGYDPIQKYLAAKDHKEQGYTELQIAGNFRELTNRKEKTVKDWLEVYDLMEEYLEYIDQEGIYTALEGREESFLNLRRTLNSFKTGRAGKRIWAFEDVDLMNLKLRYFDYIWENKKTHDFRDFSQVFCDEERWKKFNANVKEVIKNAEMDSFDDYREKYPDEDVETISKIRENDYKEKCEKELNRIYGQEKSVNISLQLEETPWNLLDQIQGKIDKLDSIIDEGMKGNKKTADIFESEEFYNRIINLREQLGAIKMRLD